MFQHRQEELGTGGNGIKWNRWLLPRGALRDSIVDRIEEDALRLKQPKASYEDKRQLLLDFAQSILEGDSGKASGKKELDQEGGLRGRIGNASIIRQRLARDLETDLQVRFIGETIGSPEELAVKAQALRNPRFETFYPLAAKRRTKRQKLASDIAVDFKVNFIGETLDSAEKLASLAMSLRNPSFETFYLFALKWREGGMKIAGAMPSLPPV